MYYWTVLAKYATTSFEVDELVSRQHVESSQGGARSRMLLRPAKSLLQQSGGRTG